MAFPFVRRDSDGEAVVKVYLKSSPGDFSATLEMTYSPQVELVHGL